MSAIVTNYHSAGRAFDSLANDYDELFTCSVIGRAQRDAVWQALLNTFRLGERILEINCGTGEDALFLARHGMTVFACDASERMVAIAKHRQEMEAPGSTVQFAFLPTEQLSELSEFSRFDGAFSNFSGLNCVADLRKAAHDLYRLVRPGGSLLLCLSTRYSLWESSWFLAHGKIDKAFRRWKRTAKAQLGGISIDIHYPTIRELRRTFDTGLRLVSITGIGITVPPSYLEPWAAEHPQIVQRMSQVDRMICNWPIVRAVGDHVLLRFERCAA